MGESLADLRVGDWVVISSTRSNKRLRQVDKVNKMTVLVAGELFYKVDGLQRKTGYFFSSIAIPTRGLLAEIRQNELTTWVRVCVERILATNGPGIEEVAVAVASADTMRAMQLKSLNSHFDRVFKECELRNEGETT